MKIMVTGSSGRLGSAVVRDLIQNGHDVIPVDIQPAADPALPPTRQVDLRKVADLAPLMQGIDAVCHLGNYPGFHRSGRADGFSNNVSSTYNVFYSAFEAGVSRIVYASSIQAYGVVGEFRSLPAYLPVDEDHPHIPCDAYALSKAMGEQIALSFVRRDKRMQVFSMRYTTIMTPADGPRWASRLAAAPGQAAALGGLCTYVRVEDAARATRLACEIDRPGHTGLNISAPRPLCPWDAELLKSYYGGVMPPMRGRLAPDEPMLTCQRAKEILGFVADLPLVGDCPPCSSKELKAPNSAAA